MIIKKQPKNEITLRRFSCLLAETQTQSRQVGYAFWARVTLADSLLSCQRKWIGPVISKKRILAATLLKTSCLQLHWLSASQSMVRLVLQQYKTLSRLCLSLRTRTCTQIMTQVITNNTYPEQQKTVLDFYYYKLRLKSFMRQLSGCLVQLISPDSGL